MSTKFGGMITLRSSAGQIFAGRGTFTVTPSRMSVEAVTNDDGSLARVGTPKPAAIEITFEDRGANIDALMKADDVDFTAIEEFTGVTHHLSKAFFTGDPSINRRTGEVTGVSLAGETYQRTAI